MAVVVTDLHSGSSGPRIFEVDHAEDGMFSADAGLGATRAALLEAVGIDRPLPAVLIVGLWATRDVGATPSAREDIGALLEWPGAAYLQFGFSKHELRSATARIIEGARAPLPQSMLSASRTDLLRASSNVRHWLEGRLNNEEGALSDFSSVARGAMQIAPEHLEPRDAVPDEHQDMLDRLCMLGTAARRYLSIGEGLAGIQDSMRAFEAAWRSLEQTRARYLVQHSIAEPTLGTEFAASVCAELKEVVGTLERAIAATRQFDEQIRQRTANE